MSGMIIIQVNSTGVHLSSIFALFLALLLKLIRKLRQLVKTLSCGVFCEFFCWADFPIKFLVADGIDLLNVSFDGLSAPDRISAKAGLKELRRIAPLRR